MLLDSSRLEDSGGLSLPLWIEYLVASLNRGTNFRSQNMIFHIIETRKGVPNFGKPRLQFQSQGPMVWVPISDSELNFCPDVERSTKYVSPCTKRPCNQPTSRRGYCIWSSTFKVLPAEVWLLFGVQGLSLEV